MGRVEGFVHIATHLSQMIMSPTWSHSMVSLYLGWLTCSLSSARSLSDSSFGMPSNEWM